MEKLISPTLIIGVLALSACAAGETRGAVVPILSATPPAAMTGSAAADAVAAPDGADASSTVIIIAPRPVIKAPGLLSFNGLSLASPFAEPTLPAPPPPANSFFAGLTGGMPHKLLLGSAPDPTPDDLCVYGSAQAHCYADASRQQRRIYIADPVNPGHFRELRAGDEKIIETQLRTEKLIHQSLFWLEK